MKVKVIMAVKISYTCHDYQMYIWFYQSPGKKCKYIVSSTVSQIFKNAEDYNCEMLTVIVNNII